MTYIVDEPRWALCLGGAAEVWTDVAALEALIGRPWPGLVIAANDVGAHWSRRLDHWVSLHAYKFPRWTVARDVRGYPNGYALWGRSRDAAHVHRVVEPWAGGSSGMLAVQAAHELGCTRAVLCGVPMTMTAHFPGAEERFHAVWYAANGHWTAWRKQAARMEGWVKSMSGRTRELFGAPEIGWLTAGGLVP